MNDRTIEAEVVAEEANVEARYRAIGADNLDAMMRSKTPLVCERRASVEKAAGN